MTKIRIATDSTADIPKAIAEELDITVLPLTILAEGKEYRDGVDITPEEFYDILEKAETMPVSSQVYSHY
ncbi:MAG: DegV family protein [Oscillospiraceae bacterium]|nr:DegV family protein [Oscillospiraceae bacterium]